MSDAPEHFYEPVSAGAEAGQGTFRPTVLTRGPWDAESQHAGPPAALLARAFELLPGIGSGPADRSLGRITLEILRPVPIAELRVEARIARPGRRVELLEGSLAEAGGEGRELVRARAWRLAAEAVDIPAGLASADGPDSAPARAGRPAGVAPAPPPPDALEASAAFFPTGQELGYHTAMEYRFATGGFLETGPAICWMRMRVPLLAGEEPTPLQRVMTAADTGNGISSALDFRRWVFINVDLTVHLHRLPGGEWVCLDSLTIPEPNGQGMSDTMLLDERGPLGRACQTLLVAER